jgi:molybdate transport system regulatory protein
VARLSLRLDFSNGERLGPGKVELLERIHAHGSIAAAGRTMRMSYKRAWELVDSLNRTFREPVVATRHGGERGGGAMLTPFGEAVIGRYRAMQAAAEAALAADIAALEQAQAPAGR